jgi:hypothetical protein
MQPLGYGLEDQGTVIRFPAGARGFPLLFVQTGTGAQPPSSPAVTGGSFLEVNLVADHSRLSSVQNT